MWKCRCGTENRTPGKRCYYCRRLNPEPVKDGEWLSLGVGCIIIAFLIAFAAAIIGDVYQIPALEHYGVIAFFLTLGLATFTGARADQKSGLGGDDFYYLFWFDITFSYAIGICFIVYAVISFLFPSTFSLGH